MIDDPATQEVILATERRTARLAERNARREVIDYIAASMAFHSGRTWGRMTEARRELMRAQARAALMAVRRTPPALWDAESYIAVAAAKATNDGSDAHTITEHFEAYLCEVLR